MLGAEGFCKGYPQGCSQNLWVGLGRSGLPPLARENGRDGILPTKHGQLSGGWNRFLAWFCWCSDPNELSSSALLGSVCDHAAAL